MATGLQQTVPATNVTASALLDWSSAWAKVKNYPSASVTLGTPLLFATVDKGSNAGNYIQ